MIRTSISARLFSLMMAGLMIPSVVPCLYATADTARWIWSDPGQPAPKNRFTYFRTVAELDRLPQDSTLLFAADSNARLWINGHIVRRKVARYHEEKITAEVINAAPYLRVGKNVVCVLHHNWGGIITFQRTGNQHAGLYVDSEWVKSDASWRCLTAPEFLSHETQIVGVIGDHRIRYPVIIDGRQVLPGDIHDPAFDDCAWSHAVEVTGGPWPEQPRPVETPGQREYFMPPLSVLAAGMASSTQPVFDGPLAMASRIRTAVYLPSPAETEEAGHLLNGRETVIRGQAGETHYITFDFGLPAHGYPRLEFADAPAGTVIDLGYCELARALYNGEMHVRPDGWINPERVVGKGYADRYITRAGSQTIEFPDERTARWLSVHVHFPVAGEITLKQVGMIKSQYPINPIGSFSCGDQRIDQIVKLCLIHAEVTMSDSYVDTPGREDGQWIEDARPRALISASWFGDNQLRRFLIRTHAEGQGPDGDFHPFAPSNYPAYPAPYDWSVQWIAFLYDEYMWTGDTALIETYWPNVVKYWDNVLSHVNEDGLWLTNRVLADIRVGLHCVNDKQSSGIVTPWIIERLRWTAVMAGAIGQTDLAERWRATADRMALAFRQYHIVPASGGIPAHVADRFDPADPTLERGYSQAGQTIAITSGLMTKDEARLDLDYAFPAPDGTPPPGVTRWNNPTYGYRVLRALSENGFSERAVAHLLERYAPYLPGHPRNPVPPVLQGPYGGPLPEYWVSREDLNLKPGEINTAQPEDETGSHGWQAVPLLWMHDTLLGVRITEPGGGRIRIHPDAAGLPYVAGHVGTPKGIVWVSWDPQTWTMELELPGDVTADVTMPDVCQDKPVKVLHSPDGGVPAQDGMRFTLAQGGKYIIGVR